MRKNNVKKFFVQMFAALFIFESVLASGMPLMAKTVSENALPVENTKDIVDESIQEVRTSQPEMQKNVVTEEVEAEKAIILYSGTMNDLEYTIDSNGHLYLTGSGDYDWITDWYYNTAMAKAIKTATVDAVGMTNTSDLFLDCENLTSVDFSKFDTSQVTDMGQMFDGCSSLTSLDVSKFDTSQVTSMFNMFCGCSSLTTLGVSKFDTSRVTNMGQMFSGCSSLTSLDVSKFDTSRVTDMSSMFSGCSSLTSLDVSKFDTSQVTDMGRMFDGCSSLTSLDVSKFDTSQVTSMCDMFNGCSSLTTLGVSKFDTSQVMYMQAMFEDCSSLTSLDVSKFNTSQVTMMWGMFRGCSSLKSIDVSKFDTSQVTSMNIMFDGCSSLKSIDVSKFNTSQVTEMRGMFRGCSNLISIDLSKLNTSQVTDMDDMFSGCSNLTSLDLSKFDTSQVTDMSSMFEDCSSLTSLDVSKFDTSQVTDRFDMLDMFYGCSSLTTIIAPQNKSSHQWRLPWVDGYVWCYKPNNTCVATITKAGTYVRVKEGTTPEEEETTPTIKKGTKFKKSNIQYEVVTNTSSKHTVKVYKGTKNTATSIKIPKTVTYKGITFDVVSIRKNAFKGYKKATKLTIGNKVTSVGESAFQNCTKLKTVTIGNAVTSIGKKAFYGCKALTSVSITSKVKTIGASAFSKCTKLKTVIIGSSLKTIGASAFKGASKLITINIYSKKLSKVGKSAFSGINKYAKIYVPDSKLSAYKKLLKNRGQKSSVKIVKQANTKYTGKSVIAIGNCKISYEKEIKYTGKAIKPKVTVTYNNSTLKKGTNYTVSYKNNIEPGTATIVIKGKGIYVGTVEKEFTIYNYDMGWPIKDSGQFEIWGLDYYKGGTKHNGVDITPSDNTERKIAIYPVFEGTVKEVGKDTSAGYYVIIKHTISDETYLSYYFHMESKSGLKKGNIVDENTVLGYMGSTGNSTGKHLHFAIVKHSKPWDAEYYKQNAKTFQYYVDTKSVIPKGIRFSTNYIKKGKSEYCSWIKNNCTKKGNYYVYN